MYSNACPNYSHATSSATAPAPAAAAAAVPAAAAAKGTKAPKVANEAKPTSTVSEGDEDYARLVKFRTLGYGNTSYADEA